MPMAKDLLEAQAAKLPAASQVWPLPGSVGIEFDLGEMHFSLLLADEDAKANVNSIVHSNPDGPNAVASLIGQMVAGAEGLAVHLESPPAEGGPGRPIATFCSWGQIFEPTNAGSPSEFASRLRDATRDITCWGSGRLNIRRASDEAIRLVCANHVAPDVLNKLIAHRHEPGVTGVAALLDGLALRELDRMTLERLLSDRSSHYSLWTFVRGPQRSWATLAIGDGYSAQGALERFSW